MYNTKIYIFACVYIIFSRFIQNRNRIYTLLCIKRERRARIESGERKNMLVGNNFTQSFNAWILDILEARVKPIIKMLEEIRVQVMRFKVKNEKKLKTWVTDFSPECMKLYIDYRAIAHSCKVEFNRDWVYEVSDGEDRHTVNLKQKTCTCRIWDLSGIPYPYAIKALTHKKVDPIIEIHWWYSKEAYMITYKNKMQPVRGQKFWKVDPSSAMLPHNVVKQLGRPIMKRNREPDEARKRKGE